MKNIGGNMASVKHSVVIPTYCNNKTQYDNLIATLQSVHANSPEATEVILVNDGSKYPEAAFAHLVPTTYVQHKVNKGIATSWNDGITIARGYYITVINDDVTVQKGWLEALENAVNWPDALVSAPGVYGKENFTGIEDNYQWFPGYCFMLTQDTIDKIGIFDEQFSPFNYEDTDYWTRCLKSGGLLMRNYSTMIKHLEGHVLHTLDYDGVSAENKKKFIAKHGFDPIPVFYEGAKAPWDE